MALLAGKVKSARLVSGEYKEGKRKGEEWEFLSLDIIDEDSGHIWNCQLNPVDNDDEAFDELKRIGSRLMDHQVSCTVKGQTAGPRKIKKGGKEEEVIQIRSQITGLQDLGVPTRRAA